MHKYKLGKLDFNNILKNKKIAIILGLFFLFLIGFLFIKLSFTFELEGDKIVEVSYKDLYEEKGVKITFLGHDLSKKVKIDGAVTSYEIGEYKITYSYTFAFVPLKKTRIVKVKDMDKPYIELKGEKSQTICPNHEYEEEGYTATDEHDGDLTDKVEIIEEGNIRKYKVSDSSGNTVVVEREIIKKDEQKPTITLVGGSTIYVKRYSEYKEFGYKAMDMCDGDITKKVHVTGSVDTSLLQTFTLTYQVEDSSGNETTIERRVVINEEKTSLPTTPGVIYLTFDDGPSGSGSTAKILDILKEEGVHATFFVTGSGPDSLIKREHEEGHVVALHTYSHQYQNIYKSVDAYFRDLTKIQDRIKRLTGEEAKVIRFPGGSNNTVSNKYNRGIMETLRPEALNRGFSYFDWNVDASDAWRCAKPSVKDKKTCVYKNVTSTLSKKRANVVLMHDIKSYTADALRDIIRYAKNQGYTFDVLTTGTNPVRFQ